MEGVSAAWLHWIALGLRAALGMVWMTWWPLVLGFCLAGLVQSLVPREGLRARLGTTSARTVGEASLYGALSSSCSYAASAVARALFARGASWTNSLVFMVASTNLVVELGVVLWIVLGGPFLLAQLVGGVIMIAVLALCTGLVFRGERLAALGRRVRADAPPVGPTEARGWRERARARESYVAAARYTRGDLTMVRKELVAGFLVAGFLSAHLPTSWWRHAFFHGHGALTVLENVVVAPLLASLSCVCSVGNIPLAAAMWQRGVAFGGVIAFIFADLLALPLLAIYRRFYGGATTARLFVVLWFAMSVAGALVDALFAGTGLAPTDRHVRALDGHFPLGATLVANVAATALLGATWWLSRAASARPLATDPVCGMSVDPADAVASVTRGGVTTYFCSPRCRDRYVAGATDDPAAATAASSPPASARDDDAPSSARDPVCGMTVDPRHALAGMDRDGVTYYFCAEGCRSSFLARAPRAEPTDQARP